MKKTYSLFNIESEGTASLDSAPSNQPETQQTVRHAYRPQPQQKVEHIQKSLCDGMRAGEDPYPLLLQAIECISILTGDTAFYTVFHDVMQCMGVLERMPTEWVQEAANEGLARLKETRRNIDSAIAACEGKYGGQMKGDGADADYAQRIKRCFGDAYKFLANNKHVRTDDDWERVVTEAGKYTDPLTVDLISAAINEMEREQCADMQKAPPD